VALVNVQWIVVGLAIVGAIVGLITARRRRGENADLGAVSHQWIAEHRMGSRMDSRR
jgi:hypothetical protein